MRVELTIYRYYLMNKSRYASMQKLYFYSAKAFQQFKEQVVHAREGNEFVLLVTRL